MKNTLLIRLLFGFAALSAIPGFALGQTVSNTPSVSHPTNSAVSAPVSDLPLAHSAQGVQDLKVVPPPKPVLPRGVGPVKFTLTENGSPLARCPQQLSP